MGWITHGTPADDAERSLTRHPRRSALAGTEHLETRAEDLSAPPVVGGGVDAHEVARLADVAELRREAEQPQPEPEEHVIIDHGAAPPAHRLEHDKHGDAAPPATRSGGHQVSGELGTCSPP